MLTADEIREELIRQLDAGRIKASVVAKLLKVAPARVSEMRKRTRQVQQGEMRRLANFLGLLENPRLPTGLLGSHQVPHLGRVAQGVWVEESLAADENRRVIYDRRPGDAGLADLFAVTPEGVSMNLKFPEGCTLICRAVGGTDTIIKSGDYVIVERVAHDLREYTCKRYEVTDSGEFWLHSESSDTRYREPWRIGRRGESDHTDMEIRIIGKVIRAIVDLE